MRSILRSLALGLIASAVLGSSASAQLYGGDEVCSHGGAVAYMQAIACAGSFAGNNLNQETAVLSKMATSFQNYTGPGSYWSYVGDPNFTGGGYGNIQFNNAVSGWFVVVLKSSNSFSMYLWNGGTTGFNGVRFTDIGTAVNSHGSIQDLSHASLYAWNGAPISAAPEPAALLLVATGLAGLLVVLWARARNAAPLQTAEIANC